MRKISEVITGVDEQCLKILTDMHECSKEDILFLDIETTGLSPRNSDIYLIGTGYCKDGIWRSTQFFAESKIHEEEILSAFSELALGYKKVVHFNGDRFDIPFLQAKYTAHMLSDPFGRMDSIDMLKLIKPYKNQLGLPDCKQKTIELYLGIDRDDKYDGGKLIPVYREYASTGSEDLLNLLLLHNSDDIKGMLRLLPMMNYIAFFELFKNMPKISVKTDEEIDESKYYEKDENDNPVRKELPLRAVKVQANYYKDYDGNDRKEVYMKLLLPFELPSSLSGNESGCFFKAEKKEATLKVPLYDTELKFFYANYKDYYYLPKEDMAIHKSLATFVDKDYKEKAKPENCYTKKKGQYLMEWDLVFAPFFKRDYGDRNFYFDLNENMKKSRFAMSLYACHTIAHILDL